MQASADAKAWAAVMCADEFKAAVELNKTSKAFFEN